MKNFLCPILSAALLIALGACSRKDEAPATPQATDLEGGSWRMTAYTKETGAQNSPVREMHDYLHTVYDSNDKIKPCLNLNTIVFQADGKVVWNKEVGSCNIRYNNTYFNRPPGPIDWGKWSKSSDAKKLFVTGIDVTPGYSMLPVMLGVTDAYDIEELNETTLVLSTTRLTGPAKDSIRVERAVFTRVP